jgi:hypothetical protein
MSIDRNRLKRLLAAALFVLVALVGAGVIGGGALLQLRANQGADPADAFTETPEAPPALDQVVRWIPDGPLQERPVEPATRSSVEAAWTRAWEALARAAGGDPSLLEDQFSGAALDRVRAAHPAVDDAPVLIELGRHDLQVVFYSDDGSVLGLRADPIRVSRTVDGEFGPRTRTTDEAYDVALLLEDGNWRIRQWVRTSTTPVLDGP